MPTARITQPSMSYLRLLLSLPPVYTHRPPRPLQSPAPRIREARVWPAAMDAPANDLDRLFFFEMARKNAETAYAKNPLDAENLTRWGGALLELSQFQSGQDSVSYIKEAVVRLEEALEVNPRKHDALWCLGNAHTSHAFFTPENDVASGYFKEATECFRKALEEDPENDLYVKSLDLSLKAPEVHLELQRQMTGQVASRGPSASNVRAPDGKESSNLKYDILGWVILAVGIVAWIGMAKSHPPPPPPPM